MKKFVFILAFAIITLVSCNLDPKDSWFTPSDIELAFVLQDSEGQNLMDTTYTGNWADTTIYCTFNGTTYNMNETKTAPILTPYTYYSNGAKIYTLYFGYLAGDQNYDDDLIFYWPNGKKSVIRIYNQCTYATSSSATTSTTTRQPVTELVRSIVYNNEVQTYLPIYLTVD